MFCLHRFKVYVGETNNMWRRHHLEYQVHLQPLGMRVATACGRLLPWPRRESVSMLEPLATAGPVTTFRGITNRHTATTCCHSWMLLCVMAAQCGAGSATWCAPCMFPHKCHQR